MRTQSIVGESAKNDQKIGELCERITIFESGKQQSQLQLNQIVMTEKTLNGEKQQLVFKHEELMQKIGDEEKVEKDSKFYQKTMQKAQQLLEKVKVIDTQLVEGTSQTEGIKEWKSSSKKQL